MKQWSDKSIFYYKERNQLVPHENVEKESTMFRGECMPKKAFVICYCR